MRHFLDLHTTPAAELRAILDAAGGDEGGAGGTRRAGAPDAEPALAGRVVALVFEKPSTRTRVSFDVGVRQMGGETIVLSGGEMQLGHGETIADTARVLSRFVDLVMIRTFDPATLQEMAEHAVGAGDQRADRREPPLPDHGRRDDLRGAPRADRAARGWSGRGTATTSAPRSCTRPGSSASTSSSPGRRPTTPRRQAVAFARGSGVQVEIERDPLKAAAGADLVVTDTWLSMHDPQSARERRHALLRPYQVNEALMAAAKPEALFMHCLPAHRERGGDERGDGRAALGGLRRGGEPAARAEGDLRWCLGV